ncbi:hypothetical protein DVH24_033961 [Malus domestica]|uniref:Uncharacterized protein n=1 Tax=Malus domestica TaxID=3750 RepID=A0A498KSC0_MALDO|nr:hypothetical protein DVH24_033961 [Malus domestica]
MSSVSVQQLSVQRPHWRHCKPKPFDHTSSTSPSQTTGEVNALKEEVTALKGQLTAQDEKMSIIVRALQMSFLQIPMPAPDLTTFDLPATSPNNTQ